ncbi:hypothetical protein NDI39_12720 [Microcoleus sp. ZQ-A2]|nr:hypothetical protein [Microcoleus sp. FACHB-1]
MPRQFLGNFLNPWRSCQTLLQKAYSRHSWELLILLWLNGSPLAIAFSMIEVIHDISAPLGQPEAILCKSSSIPLCTCGGWRGGSRNE